ncbi:MAG: hypothetical protein M9921_04355 [Fimbriimonadaceae bacterium]|nr:hypothetical protein [Chthonomonadaceae bacterium]MCO5296068.1 hypothetical protein [Fimbriimonadaceae bacterium]
MFLLYNFLLTVLSPLWVPWMLVRSARRAEKPNWAERQGDLPLKPDKGAKRIWIHAVSVGEVVACLPILREVRRLLPSHEIVLSVTTSSGHQTAREQAKEWVDHLVYFPIDVPRFQLAAMSRVRPQVVAIMETELWMNFLWAAKEFDAATILMNGRISDRSYPRSKRFRWFYASLLKYVDQCLMQTEQDVERILSLGARTAHRLGNAKFDQALDALDVDREAWRRELDLPEDRPVVVIGSTRGEEEEAFVLEAIQKLGESRVAVVHAPRHLERVPELAEAVRARFGKVALRSKGEGGCYVVLDTYGELAKVYAVADIVVIGGGFANHGGQNLLQPLALGKPVLHGPHMQNFAEVAAAAKAAGATRVCETPGELANAIRELIEAPACRRKIGQAAANFIAENAGASLRYAEAIAAAATER